MEKFSSNCYGFVYAGLRNSDEYFFKWADDIEYGKTLKKWKLSDTIYETTEEIIDVLIGFAIIEIFDEEWKSQHVAFLDYNWKIYDQDWPDWPIRTNITLDDLLSEYKEKLGNLTYKIHDIKDSQKENVKNFINEVKR